jgi:hypothetical protein
MTRFTLARDLKWDQTGTFLVIPSSLSVRVCTHPVAWKDWTFNVGDTLELNGGSHLRIFPQFLIPAGTIFEVPNGSDPNFTEKSINVYGRQIYYNCSELKDITMQLDVAVNEGTQRTMVYYHRKNRWVRSLPGESDIMCERAWNGPFWSQIRAEPKIRPLPNGGFEYVYEVLLPPAPGSYISDDPAPETKEDTLRFELDEN